MLSCDRKQVKSSNVYLGGVIDPALSSWFVARLKDIGLG